MERQQQSGSVDDGLRGNNLEKEHREKLYVPFRRATMWNASGVDRGAKEKETPM